MKQVSWVLALVIGVAIGFFAKSALVGGTAGGPNLRPAAAPGAQAQRPARPQEDPKAVYKVALGDSPVRGPADALVTIIESSDFECPFCKRVGPTLKQLEQAFPGKLRFAFKHNPLPFHQNALPAALAAEEARAQKGDAGCGEEPQHHLAKTGVADACIQSGAQQRGNQHRGGGEAATRRLRARDSATHRNRTCARP